MMNFGNDWSWGGMALGVVFWAVLLAAIIVATVWVARSYERTAASHVGGGAGAVLDQRLARGEIAEAEYREKKSLLG